MTSPYYQSQGGYSDALAGMYDSAGALQLKELEQRYKISKDEISARLKIAGQQSKDTRYGIDSQRDSERERLAHLKDEMERIGIPRMLIEKYVAEKTYEIALSEMTLKRDVFVEETAQAREKLKLDREEMERIGIPRVDIERYVAQENAKIARAQQTGYVDGQQTLDRERFGEEARQFNIQQSGYIPGSGGGPGQATLERERFMADEAERARRYGLDVGKFGAELASTPDTYFQARRFQGVDIPRLLGGAGAATADATGGPTPGVATMGAYLSGQDPYAPVPPAVAAPGAPPASPGGPGGLSALSAQEQARYEQLVARRQQTGGTLDPVDEDELQRFTARGAGPGASLPTGAPGYGVGLGPKPQTLSAQEQARFEQLVARAQQTGGVLDPVDQDELQRFTARGARPPGGPDMIAPHGPINEYGDPIDTTYASGPPTFDEGGSGGFMRQLPDGSWEQVGGRGAGGGGMFRGGPSDQYGAPIGGYQTPVGPETGWYRGDQGGGPEDGWRGITDPGYGPSSSPYGDRMRELGGGGLNSYSPGATKPEIAQAAYGSMGSDMRYASATPSVYGGPAVSASVGPQGYAMPSWYTQQQGRQASPYPSQDPRQKQLAALAKALPPSPYSGLNEQDSAALKAMESIYKGGGGLIAGGEYERIKSSPRFGFLQSAGKILGFDPKQLEHEYQSYRPAQGSSRLAG